MDRRGSRRKSLGLETIFHNDAKWIAIETKTKERKRVSKKDPRKPHFGWKIVGNRLGNRSILTEEKITLTGEKEEPYKSVMDRFVCYRERGKRGFHNGHLAFTRAIIHFDQSKKLRRSRSAFVYLVCRFPRWWRRPDRKNDNPSQIFVCTKERERKKSLLNKVGAIVVVVVLVEGRRRAQGAGGESTCVQIGTGRPNEDQEPASGLPYSLSFFVLCFLYSARVGGVDAERERGGPPSREAKRERKCLDRSGAIDFAWGFLFFGKVLLLLLLLLLPSRKLE